MLSYEALFFDEEMLKIIYSLETNHLEIVNDIVHCTFRYHPEKNEIFNEIVGKTFDIYLIGYGCDGENSGFLIEIPKELKKYYINYEDETKEKLRIPHITTSSSKNSTFRNTKNLNFKPLNKKVKITGKFGFWIKEKDKEYLSYEPYYN